MSAQRGRTPFHLAAEGENTAIMEMLLHKYESIDTANEVIQHFLVTTKNPDDMLHNEVVFVM